MQRTGVVEGSVLEDQATEVTVSSNDVVSLFFLTELVTIVLGLSFGGFTNQRRSNQRTVHCTKQRTTEHTCYAEHMEGVHEDVVLCLENKHVVECTTDTQGHCVRERTLTERIDQEDCGCCCNRCRVCNTDPRAHTKAVKRVPTHDPCRHRCRSGSGRLRVGKDHRCKKAIHQGMREAFPNGVKVKTNCIGTRDDSTRDDVVAIHERTCNRFTNTIDGPQGEQRRRRR